METGDVPPMSIEKAYVSKDLPCVLPCKRAYLLVTTNYES